MKRPKNKTAPKEITHKPLGEEFNVGGFKLTQIKREGDVAIFTKAKIKKAWCDFYEAGFEVGIIKRHNGYMLGGQFIEPAETWPCTSLFGILGWAFVDLRDAETKFRELVQAVKNKTLAVGDEEVTTGDEE